jgi:hypothetical protein
MIKKDIEQAATKGLLEGYGKQTAPPTKDREGFTVSSNHFEEGDIAYHDEWVTGGGQELVKTGEDYFTRVYAGDVVLENLHILGIKEIDVIMQLISFINSLGDKTRLNEECHPEPVGPWEYSYTIIKRNPLINQVIGEEVITYNGMVVFIHAFIMNPARQ